MKGSIFGKGCLAFVVVLAVGLAALPASAGETSYGLKAGLTYAKLDGNDVSGADYKQGFCGGLAVNYSLIPLLSFQPEILYSMKGAEVDGQETSLDYIEIPVLVKLSIPIPFLMIPDLYAGPYAGIKIGADSPGVPADDFETLDYGIVFGGGFDIGLVALSITIDARYSMGMKSVHKYDDAKNQVISVIAGLMF